MNTESFETESQPVCTDEVLTRDLLARIPGKARPYLTPMLTRAIGDLNTDKDLEEQFRVLQDVSQRILKRHSCPRHPQASESPGNSPAHIRPVHGSIPHLRLPLGKREDHPLPAPAGLYSCDRRGQCGGAGRHCRLPETKTPEQPRRTIGPALPCFPGRSRPGRLFYSFGLSVSLTEFTSS